MAKLFEEYRRQIANNIREWRLLNRVKGPEIAKKTGMTPATLSDWENERIPTGILLLRKLAEEYDLSLDKIILNREPQVRNSSNNNPDVDLIIEALESDADLLKTVLEIIRAKQAAQQAVRDYLKK